MTHSKVVVLKKDTDTRVNIKVDAQRRSMKAILLLFVEPYAAGPGEAMYSSGTCLVNTKDGVQLKIERGFKGSGIVNCHIFVISDSQYLDFVQY